MLYEFRFHGRGGQGAVTAAELLVKAANIEGKWGQSFPFFGAERRGAPVTAFARISEERKLLHSQIYRPDAVAVLDRKIADTVDVSTGLKQGGLLVFNSPTASDLRRRFSGFKVFYVNATKIAEDLGLSMAGWAIVNTPVLGAVVKAVGLLKLESVVEAIELNWPGRTGQANSEAARRAFNEVSVL
ncbi:MAG: 2-oxoacid:acceptor oxidoreductase family protein [Nitrososphaeria archaeon]